MQINLNSIPFLGSVNKVSNNNSQGTKINQGPVSDVFVKSTGNVSSVSRFQDDRYIAELYNQTYDEVMAQNIKNNPVIGELNIKKPKLVIGNKEDAAEDASYMFPSNTITLQKSTMDKDIAVVHYEDEGQQYVLDVLPKERTADYINRLEKEYPDVKFSSTVLNDDEKELFIKSSIAHELRHAIQMHLVASTEGCEDVIEKYKEKFHQLQSLIKEVEAIGEFVDKKTKMTCNSDYIDRYKPKKILPSDIGYKYSLVKENPKQISVKNGLAKSCKLQMNANKNDGLSHEIYLSLPHEIDAYNYEAEYLFTQMKNKKGNARDNILEDVALYTALISEKGIENALRLGINPFEN